MEAIGANFDQTGLKKIYLVSKYKELIFLFFPIFPGIFPFPGFFPVKNSRFPASSGIFPVLKTLVETAKF